MEKKSLYQDSLFRKIVVGSTGLGLACMLGSAAAIRIAPGTGLQFGWHWSILLVVALVILWNARFWKLLWRMQDGQGGRGTRALALHLGILLLLGFGTFVYPIRFLEQSHWNGILRGLVTAASFLGTMLWLIYKCAKGFDHIDALEQQRVTNSGT